MIMHICNCNHFVYLDIFSMESLYSYKGYVLLLLNCHLLDVKMYGTVERKLLPSVNAVSCNVSKIDTKFMDLPRDLDLHNPAYRQTEK